jgi:TPR repeat protein
MDAADRYREGAAHASAGRAAEAALAFTQAARLGHTDAIFALGVCFHDGMGVERNDFAALLHFRAAAARGHVEAALFVGMLVETGVGIAPDLNEALLWYRRAEAHPLAREARERLLERATRLRQK